MNANDLLKLEPSIANVMKIDLYLASETLSEDYIDVLIHLANIIYELNDNVLAYKILYEMIGTLNFQNDLKLYDAIINLKYLDEDYKEVLALIEKEKALISEKDYYIRLIEYYEKLEDDNNLIKVLNTYLTFDIEPKTRIIYIKKLLLCYYKINDYYNFKLKKDSLMSLALNNGDKNDIILAKYYECLCLEHDKKDQEALTILNELLSGDNASGELLDKIVILKLDILVSRLKEFRQATIFEAKYNELIDDMPVYLALKYVSLCITLYQELGNSFNVNIYQNRYQLLELQNVKKPKEARKYQHLNYDLLFLKRDEKTNDIQEELEIDINVEEKETKKEKEKIEEPKEIKFSIDKKKDAILNLDLLFEELNLKKYSKREYLRHFFLYLSEIVSFKEAYILIFNEQYHYKKERLYDKKNDLTNTILLDTYSKMKDYSISNTKETSYKSLLKGIPYKDLDTYKLISISSKYGAVVFNLSSIILLEDIKYFVLKLALRYLDIYLYNLEQEQNIKDDYDMIIKLLDEKAIGYYKLEDRYVTLSNNLAKILKMNNKVMLDEYMTTIENNYVSLYMKDINDLVFKYKNIDNYSHEYRIKTENGYFGLILKKKAEDNKNLRIDSSTKLYNKAYLSQYYDSKLKDIIFGIGIFKIQNIKYYEELYGLDFTFEIDSFVGRFLKEKEDIGLTFFKLEDFKYIVVFENLKDRRTILKYLEEMVSNLEKAIHELNTRVDLDIRCAYLRTNMAAFKSLDDIISNLYYSLSSDKKVVIYNKNDVNDLVFANNLTTYISESIDANTLKINYSQVINYQNKNIKYLIARLNLNNLDVSLDTLNDVIKKRDLVVLTEKYLLHRGIFELSEIKNKKKYFLPFLFKISYETLVFPSFVSYLKEQTSFFKTPISVIQIYYDGILDQNSIKVLKELAKLNVRIVTSDLNMLRFVKIATLFYQNSSDEDLLIKDLFSYLENRQIEMAITDIKAEADVSKYALIGVKYYSGQIYNRLLDINDFLK